MHSLSELRDYFARNKIKIEEFQGWYLKVGKDTWTMHNDVFYCNNLPRSIKEKTLLDGYERVIIETPEEVEATPAVRRWKAMSKQSVIGNEDEY